MSSSKLRAMHAAAVSLVVLAGAGPASAEVVTGTPEDDMLPGTPRRDTIRGLAGNDEITGGRAKDRLFGDEGADTFHWAKGDGQDRIDGGPEPENPFNGHLDQLGITAGGSLRLHIDALDAGPLTTVGSGLEAIGVREIEGIVIMGTDGADRLVISSDAGVVGQGGDLSISAGGGRDRIDVSRVRVPAHVGADVGDDWIRFGRSRNTYSLDFDGEATGRDTILGFGASDTLVLERVFRLDWRELLDTNGNGRLDAGDELVTVAGGDLTVDLSPMRHHAPGTVVVTLLGRTRLGLDRISVSLKDF